MTPEEKAEILTRAQNWFRNVVNRHVARTNSIGSLRNFKYNPFLTSYLSKFFGENPSPENLAKLLLYPRVLGTSINTLFGNAVQVINSEIFANLNPRIDGLDISFIDQRDNLRKFGRLKSGPITINNRDARQIIADYEELLLQDEAIQRGVTRDNLIFGVIYGSRNIMHGAYNRINGQFPVLIGQEFWHALTGDEGFYFEIIDSIIGIAADNDVLNLFQEKVDLLANDPNIIELSAYLQERNDQI